MSPVQFFWSIHSSWGMQGQGYSSFFDQKIVTQTSALASPHRNYVSKQGFSEQTHKMA